jgi:MscS family membrane protein
MNFFQSFFLQIENIFINGVFGYSLYEIFFIIFFFLFAIVLRGFFARIIINKLKKIILKTSNRVDDQVFDTLIPPLKILPVVFILFFISLYFDLDTNFGAYIQKINISLSTIFIFWFLHQVVFPFSFLLNRLETLLSKAIINWAIKSIKYLIIFLGIVAVLEIWGIKIGPVIAGLGLLGVAVALGAQDLFKNLISGIMILLEKRFHIGDVINVPGHTEGTVEHIGFRSTLIRKFDSTPITIPNYIFAEAPILNYSNRTNRRINWVIGLEYSSTLEQIKSFTEKISYYIKNSSDFLVNDNFKSFVRLDKFNDSSVDILVYCFTSTNDWEEFLKIKENLALKIKEEVERAGLGFAFPSHSVYIEKLKKEDIS